jgi:sarcosine oxidase delta subunit
VIVVVGCWGRFQVVGLTFDVWRLAVGCRTFTDWSRKDVVKNESAICPKILQR